MRDVDSQTRMSSHTIPAKSSVLVVGNARNCAPWILNSLNEVGRALRGFRRVQWLIVESDSEDDTATQLDARAASDPDFRVMHLGNLRSQIPLRTERLAFCRNASLQAIKTEARYADIEYVIAVDLDGLTGALTASAIESCWSRTDWDVYTANQRGPYYDIWALRHPVWSPNDCWEQCRLMSALGVSKAEAESAAVYSRIVTIPEDAEPIDVESAFGGMAVYRREAIVCGTYGGLTPAGQEVSEHVVLHQELRKRGFRIRINPRLINFVSQPSPDRDTMVRRAQRNALQAVKGAVRSVFGEDGVTRIAIGLRRFRRMR